MIRAQAHVRAYLLCREIARLLRRGTGDLAPRGAFELARHLTVRLGAPAHFAYPSAHQDLTGPLCMVLRSAAGRLEMESDRARCAMHADSLARALIAESARSAAVWPRPGRVARCGLGIATGVLPAAQRPRWREELTAELIDLGRWRQIPYSMRLVGRCWSLRRAVHRAVPDGVVR